ncbi:MAG: GNAT family N-acetyltransferase [Chitinophagales bacterium]|nr:GNAT family N-acetyltransferase [Chitinophagales bacterium]
MRINNIIVGFSIADLNTHSIWALFVKPEDEKKGIGKKLHQLMLDWYFNQSKEKLWLETAANTRAEKFYKTLGWIESERHVRKSSSPNSSFWIEIKLELTFDEWNKKPNA